MRTGLAVLVAIALALLGAPVAHATLAPAASIDGPSADILDVGGIAMAPDGSGGITYVRRDGGTPHIFVSRFLKSGWSRPQRVDTSLPFASSHPRIAAASGGRLLVVWEQAFASTVDGTVQHALMSASIDPGATRFSTPLIVDPNVGDGSAVTPSIAMTPTGQADVVYRVVADLAFQQGLTPLRPTDVFGEVRVANLSGPVWSDLGAVNRDPTLSMRLPTDANAPSIGVSPDGNGVVAWQEADLATGTARIYARRIFGSRLGIVLPVSADTPGGRPVVDDADGPTVAMTNLDGAVVAYRQTASATSSEGPRLMVNTIADLTDTAAAEFTGAVDATGTGGGTIGTPSAAMDDNDDYRVSYASGTSVRVLEGNGPTPGNTSVLGAASGTASATQETIDPDGGGTTAWLGSDANGNPAVIARQDFSNGAFQTAVLGNASGGPVSDLALSGTGLGDALIGFEQGQGASNRVLVATVKSPPGQFRVAPPADWVVPAKAKVSWAAAPSAFGGMHYAVVVDGVRRVRNLKRRSIVVPSRGLGDGLHHVQILATDAVGQQTLTPPGDLQVDTQPPRAAVTKVRRARRTLQVRVSDKSSGVDRSTVRISFGDASKTLRSRALVKHAYKRRGRYTITIKARDQVGHALDEQIRVPIG